MQNDSEIIELKRGEGGIGTLFRKVLVESFKINKPVLFYSEDTLFRFDREKLKRIGRPTFAYAVEIVEQIEGGKISSESTLNKLVTYAQEFPLEKELKAAQRENSFFARMWSKK